MSVKSGRYIIVNVQHRNSAFLSDPNDGTFLVGSHEHGIVGDEWNVKRFPNGGYSIANFVHKMSASAEYRPQKGASVVGRGRDRLWLITGQGSEGKYTIATANDELRWCLEDGWPETPITLHDGPPSDPRCQWTFQEIGYLNATPYEASKEEVALARGELEQVKAEMAITLVELDAAKEEIAVARGELEKTKAELIKTLKKLEAAKEEATAAKTREVEEAAKREDAEEEAFRKAAELEVAKVELDRNAGEVKVGKVATTNDTVEREEVELEASKKAAEVEEARQEAVQAKEELARNKLTFKSDLKPDNGLYASTSTIMPQLKDTSTDLITQLESGRYTITNVGAKNFEKMVLGYYAHEGIIKAGFKQDMDFEKWNILLLSNGKYTIQNVATGLYANSKYWMQEGDPINAEERVGEWNIEAIKRPGHYFIFARWTSWYWSLPDGEDDSRVTFSNSESERNQWFLTAVV